jgi:hypothetical protein
MNSGLPENLFEIKKTSSLSKLLKELFVIEPKLRISNPAKTTQLLEVTYFYFLFSIFFSFFSKKSNSLPI